MIRNFLLGAIHSTRGSAPNHLSPKPPISALLSLQLQPVPNELGEINASVPPCLIAAAVCTWQTNLRAWWLRVLSPSVS